MKHVLLIRQISKISNTLFVSGALLLFGCNEKEEQLSSNPLSDDLDKPANLAVNQQKQDKEVNRDVVSKSNNVVSTSKVEVKNDKQSKIVSNVLDSKENLAVEVDKEQKGIVLDLSLNLDFKDFNYSPVSDQQKLLQVVFETDESDLNLEMEAHFVGPHNENKEREVPPDGVGIGIKFGL